VNLPAVSSSDERRRALICSQALMQALVQSSGRLRAYLAARIMADQDAFGSASISDFVRIHGEQPDLLSRVRYQNFSNFPFFVCNKIF
jgi:hypothetical protein